MGMFGSASRGLFGAGQSLGRAGGIVATPEEEMRQRMLEQQMQQQMPQQPDMPQQSGQQPNFWNGGGKFGVKDGLAGILAVLGDTFSQRAGGQGGAVANLAGGRNQAMEAARAAQARQQEIAARIERARAAGLTGPQAELVGNGDAKFPDLYQKPEGLPTQARMAQWYQNATPEERAAFDATNPIVTNGYGSTVVPRAGLSQGATAGPQPGHVEDGHQFIGGDPGDPNNWRPVGGGGGNVTGGFPRPY
jgi:hypothetical protein